MSQPILFFLTTILLLSFQRAQAQCPPECRCVNNVTDCSGKNLFTLPANIPSDTQTLLLTNNRITTLDSGMFQHLPSLIVLRLTGNQIWTITADAFAGLASLQTLHLNHNNITLIRQGTFAATATPNLHYLDLSHNRLTRFDANVVSQVVQLFSNPWICDCNLLPTWRRFTQSQMSQPVCSWPPHLAGRRWNELLEHELACGSGDTTTAEVATSGVATSGVNVATSGRTSTGSSVLSNVDWYTIVITFLVLFLISICIGAAFFAFLRVNRKDEEISLENTQKARNVKNKKRDQFGLPRAIVSKKPIRGRYK